MIKALLFDFDGVLTLDETGSKSICNYISEKTGVEQAAFQEAYRLYNAELLTGKLKHEDIWQRICDAVGQQIKLEILHDSFIHTPINTDMLALVQQLKEKNYKIAMVTDNKADRIRDIVAHHDWGALFDCIAVSAEIGSGKNQEEIFHSVLHSLALEPDACVFIDNTPENLLVPKRLGVKTVFFDYHRNDVTGLTRELQTLGIASV